MTPLSRIDVDLDALSHNLALFRHLIGGAGSACRVMPVVKANGYGHGLEIVTRALLDEGMDWFGVNALEEALEVRALAPHARILVMGYVDPDRFEEALAASLDLTITNVEEISLLDAASRAAGTRARLHVKVETGTHRRGIVESDHDAVLAIASRVRGVEWVGIGTHFANIEDTINHEYAQGQLERFRAIEAALAARGLRFAMRHVACTAATLLFPETHMDLARVGIGLYGLWPSRETRISYRSGREDAAAELRPCLRWTTRLTQVKRVPAGAYVGYGCTYRTPLESLIGVIPVGYFEGYPRTLSNTAHTLVRGHRAPVRGRVCMNMTLVDLTHVPGATTGDEVTLIGTSGEESVSADDLAGWSGTINYDIVSRLSPSLERRAIRDGVPPA